MTPILGALIGIVATLIIVAVAIVFIVRTRGRSGEDSASAASPGASSKSLVAAGGGDRSVGPSSGGSVNSSKRRLVEHDVSTDEELNPDVVPNKPQNSSTVDGGVGTRNVGVSTISMAEPISLHYTPASASPYVTAPLIYTTTHHHLSGGYPTVLIRSLHQTTQL